MKRIQGRRKGRFKLSITLGIVQIVRLLFAELLKKKKRRVRNDRERTALVSKIQEKEWYRYSSVDRYIYILKR